MRPCRVPPIVACVLMGCVASAASAAASATVDDVARNADVLRTAVVATTAGTSDAAVDPARIRAVQYLAAGLERALLELRNGARLLQICVTRVHRACTKEQRRLAANDHTIALLDELTLFPQRPAPDPAGSAGNAGELRAKIAASGAALLRAAGDYDRLLIARYGAALHACPGDVDAVTYRESLDALGAVELRDFQGLDGADLDAARRELASQEAQSLETLRALPAEDCAAVFTVGQLLLEMISAKLEPWTHERRRIADAQREFEFDAAREPVHDEAPTRDLALSVAGNFVTTVATELQLQAFPASAGRIESIGGTPQAAGD
jgi:hypothetical protein